MCYAPNRSPRCQWLNSFDHCSTITASWQYPLDRSVRLPMTTEWTSITIRAYCETDQTQDHEPFTTVDMMEAIQALNTQKDCDADGLSAEHCYYAGAQFYSILAVLINQI